MYDTIRDTILTCAQKLTQVSLIYLTKPTTKKWKTEKLKSKKTDMLRSIGKQSGESVESGLKWQTCCTQKCLLSVINLPPLNFNVATLATFNDEKAEEI